MKTCPTCQKTYPDDFSLCPRDGAQLTAQTTETEAQLAAGLSRRFRIIRQLGKGGMGTVFLAEQIGVGNRPVALKVLSRKLLDDPDFLQRFQNEAASTGRIHHPNVVTIYESGQADDGTPYIAMEFLEGESLRQALSRQGALPVSEVAEILQQAARGLNAAHKLGIIHRDLKPDNIFLTYPDDVAAPLMVPPAVGAPLVGALPVGIADTGRAQGPPLRPVVVKLVDFGIAKLRESGAHTQTGTLLGTPAYMSFEQASGMSSNELDARSDIYSLGVVVYEMLTGRTPFHSDTPVGYLRMHMQEAPPPFRTVKPELPALPEVERVVMKALTKDRNQRYGSAMEFAGAFAEAAEPAPEGVGAVRELHLREGDTLLDSAVPRVPRSEDKLVPGRSGPSRRKWSLAAVPFVFLLVAAVLGYWRTGRSSPQLERTLRGHKGTVNSVAFTPDGTLLASGGEDGTVRVWDATSGQLRQTLTTHYNEVTCVALSQNGQLLASAEISAGVVRVPATASTPTRGTIEIWHVPTGTLSRTLALDWFVPLSVAFSPDGKLLASASLEGPVHLLDLDDGGLKRTLREESLLAAESVTFSRDGTVLVSGSMDGRVEIWDVASGALTAHYDQGEEVHSVAFSPDGKLVASGGNTIKVWDAASGVLKQTLIGRSNLVRSVAFSPVGNLLASGTYDKTVEVWDVTSGTLKHSLSGHSGDVMSVAFSPDGKILASGSADGTVKLWRTEY